MDYPGAFKANEAFQKRMHDSGVKDHVPTKIVTLKVRLGETGVCRLVRVKWSCSKRRSTALGPALRGKEATVADERQKKKNATLGAYTKRKFN
jgi:hypothetical protein